MGINYLDSEALATDYDPPRSSGECVLLVEGDGLLHRAEFWDVDIPLEEGEWRVFVQECADGRRRRGMVVLDRTADCLACILAGPR